MWFAWIQIEIVTVFWDTQRRQTFPCFCRSFLGQALFSSYIATNFWDSLVATNGAILSPTFTPSSVPCERYSAFCSSQDSPLSLPSSLIPALVLCLSFLFCTLYSRGFLFLHPLDSLRKDLSPFQNTAVKTSQRSNRSGSIGSISDVANFPSKGHSYQNGGSTSFFNLFSTNILNGSLEGGRVYYI